MESARIILEVVAGIVPGQPMPEYTRRWAITSAEWEAAGNCDPGADAQIVVLTRYGAACEYAAVLRNQGILNWVRLDWIYL